MKAKNTYFFLFILILFAGACKSNSQINKETLIKVNKDTTLQVGASRLTTYLPLLKGKKIGIVGNQTSIIPTNNNYTHLVDTLLTLDVNVLKVFSPEHGFRGKADAGEKVVDGVDTKTGLPIYSLYGSNKKPKPKFIKDLDVLLFDLQDVGVRFYTYISTLHYIMEAAAQHNIQVIVLDRPNPNAHYVDGPMLEDKFKSFVGMHPVPIVYGMTIGEYAKMINGEKWLQGGIQCDLTVISLENYTHDTKYNLPVKPSPNLPNAKAIELYPSLCFFEGTTVSCGRGTDKQFQVFGSPLLLSNNYYDYSFIPKPNEGAKHPKHEGNQCYGKDLSNVKVYHMNLEWLLNAFASYPKEEKFFNTFFNKLAGTNKLQEQIKLGYTYRDIRKTWLPDLEKFKRVRNRYLIYK